VPETHVPFIPFSLARLAALRLRDRCDEQIDSARTTFWEQVWPFAYDGTAEEDKSDSLVNCEKCLELY
jgi:hypothetical protein